MWHRLFEWIERWWWCSKFTDRNSKDERWNATVNCKLALCIHVYMNEGIGVFEFVIVAKFCDRRTSIFNMNF